MSDFADERTEQPTQKRLEDAVKRGQVARSPEVQTVFVLAAGLLALVLTGRELRDCLSLTMAGLFEHLHTIPIREDLLQDYAGRGAVVLGKCVGPVVGACVLAGLLAGAVQSQFRTSPEAVEVNWERLNAVAGLKRVFSFSSAVPGLLAVVRLAVIVLLTYSAIKGVVNDPIFHTAVDVAKIAQFLVASTGKILLRIIGAMVVLAAADYAYQAWRTHKDLLMSRQEVRDEAKSSEGNPEVKSRQRRLRQRPSLQRMLLDVRKADVVVTNPTYLAVGLRYDRKTMKAPKVVAKGARLNAQRIREAAREYQVPVVENKPLARVLFKYGQVGGEIPAQLYVAVAEVLAWVYRVNRYRYFAEQNQRSELDGDQQVQSEALVAER